MGIGIIERWAMLLWAFVLVAAAAFAQDVLPLPALTARVLDQTGTLTAQERSGLESRLAAFESQTGTQIIVLVVRTTAPEDIAAYAQRVGDDWKIGRRGVGDGLLLVVAKDDRTVRIEVAKALEGAVPDVAAKQIVDQAIVPAFRAGDFARGLNGALDQLFPRIKGEALPTPPAPIPVPHAAWALDEDLRPLVLVLALLCIPSGAVLMQDWSRRGGTVVTGVVGIVLCAIWFGSIVSGLISGALVVALAWILSFAKLVGAGPSGAADIGGTGWTSDIATSSSGSSFSPGWTSDITSSSDGGSGFSSGGGDFGGGGASGKW